MTAGSTTLMQQDPDRTRVSSDRSSEAGGGSGGGMLHEGSRLGRFIIERLIGSGGMGRVYRARQDEPRRTVAIKVMSRAASGRALRRFEFEAQLLARLRHPGIAQIQEVGSWDGGDGPVPWFAMEYVANARSITEYARQNGLDLRRRLALFQKACEAVAFGHQRGVIHRDLKPGNILVDGSGVVKVIDFGVARSTDSDMVATTLQTDIGQLIGTVQYMSPEQFAADPNDLDIRSDVYTLGVVLYELLGDRLPYDLRRAPVHEAARVVREEIPSPLSSVTPGARGDVEAIVEMAMSKERTRRYGSAGEMAQDIERFLSNRPVVARVPGPWHTLLLLARRHRAVAAVTVTALLALGALVGVAMIKNRQLERANAELEAARIAADANLAEAEERGRAIAAEQRETRAALQALRQEAYVSATRRALQAMVAGRSTTVRQELDAIVSLGLPEAPGRLEQSLLRFSPPQGRTLNAAGGTLVCADAAADGSRMAAGDTQGTIHVWNPADGATLAMLRGHRDRVNGADFSRDGRWLATAGDDGKVVLWDAQSLARRAEFAGHAGPAGAVAFAPDGDTLASGGADGMVRLWSIDSGQSTAQLQGHDGSVRHLAFTPDGRTLATASADQTIRLWDGIRGEAAGVPLRIGGSVEALLITPDGSQLVAATDASRLERWRLPEGTPLPALQLDAPATDLAWMDGDPPLLLATTTRGLRALDPRTGERVPPPVAAEERLIGIRPGPFGLALLTEDGTLRLQDPRSQPQRTALRAGAATIRTLAGGTGAEGLLLAGGGDGRLHTISTDTGRVTGSWQLGSAAVEAVRSRPGADDFVVLLSDGSVIRVDAQPDTAPRLIRPAGDPASVLSVAPDAASLVVATPSGELEFWSVDPPARTGSIRMAPAVPTALVHAADGSAIHVGDASGTLHGWSIRSGASLGQIAAHQGPVLAIARSTDGTQLLTGGTDGTARLWTSEGGALHPGPVLAHEAPVEAVAFDGSGLTLVTLTRDGVLHLWDRLAGKELAAMPTGLAGSRSLLVPADNAFIACGGEGGGIVIDRGRPTKVD